MDLHKKCHKKTQPFTNVCFRCILNIWAQQQFEYITSSQMQSVFGMEKDVIIAGWLQWLSHVARTVENGLPKKLLFMWLLYDRPAHGRWMKWRGRDMQDLWRFVFDEDEWYSIAQTKNRGQECLSTWSTEELDWYRKDQKGDKKTAHSITTITWYQCFECDIINVSSLRMFPGTNATLLETSNQHHKLQFPSYPKLVWSATQ